LRYDNHREVQVPDYALLRIGPFYSTVEFSQLAGYRYSRSSGAGTTYLSENRLGEVRDDGSEFPLVSTLVTRNYLILTRRTDLDLSVAATYAYYPRRTQENAFGIYLPDEGISGNLSTEFMLTPYIKGSLYDRAVYRTDYVNVRGDKDKYGGAEYRHFANSVGMDVDWLMASDKNLGLSLSRSDLIAFEEEFDFVENHAYHESALFQYQLPFGLVLGAGAAFVQTYYSNTGRSDTVQQDYFLAIGFAREAMAGFRIGRSTTGQIKVGYAQAEGVRGSRQVTEEETVVQDEGRSASRALSVHAQLDTEITKTLSQTLSFDTGLRAGYRADVERFESWEYRLKWAHLGWGAQAYAGTSEVDPEGGLDSRYGTWHVGGGLTVPSGRVIQTTLDTHYDAVVNDEEAAGDLPIEASTDYATWTTTLGVRFPLTRRTSFAAEASHVKRMSDAPELEYTRDTLAANVIYSIQF
jgi:hypothetical protein